MKKSIIQIMGGKIFYLIVIICLASCSNESKKETRKIKQINTIAETFEESIGFWEVDTNRSKKIDNMKNFIIDSLYISSEQKYQMMDNDNLYTQYKPFQNYTEFGDYGIGSFSYQEKDYANVMENSKMTFRINKEKEIQFYYGYGRGVSTFKLINSDTGIHANNYFYKKYIFERNYGLPFFVKLYKNQNLFNPDFVNLKPFDLITRAQWDYIDHNKNLLQMGEIIGLKESKNDKNINVPPYQFLQVRIKENDTIDIILPIFKTPISDTTVDDFYQKLQSNKYIFFKTVFINSFELFTELKIIQNDFKDVPNKLIQVGFIGMGGKQCFEKINEHFKKKGINIGGYTESNGVFELYEKNDKITLNENPSYIAWTDANCNIYSIRKYGWDSATR